MVPVLVAALLVLVQYASGAEVCCADIGCFSNSSPFALLPLPTCPAALKPELNYRMYTRSNRVIGQNFDHKGSIPSVYGPGKRTVFLVHGWTQDGSDSFLTDMKNAFLDREDLNVVIVDWGGGASQLNYQQSASNTRTVGAMTALVYQNILKVSGSAASRLWCAGHSLGSHVCGHAGMKMPNSQKLGRITGMDPAGPSFESHSDKTVGLNPSAATFVDVIHTDGGNLGTVRDIGHADYYPNGGQSQPGCIGKDFFRNEGVEQWDDETPEQYSLCGHARSNTYLTESAKKDCFITRQICTSYSRLPGSCSSCTGCGVFPCGYMGFAADSSCRKSGIFYLETTSRSPYCQS